MRSGWGTFVGAGVVVLSLAAGCTSAGDDDASDTEVGGAVLERDDDGEPVAADDPDEDRIDPRDDTEAPTDDDAAQSEGDAEMVDESDDDEASDPGASDGTDEGPEPEATEVDDPPATGGSPAAPAPAQPARPTPQTLAAGPGLDGDIVGFGEDGAEVLIGAPIEATPPTGARSDAIRPSAADDVRCQTALQAPQDRGLIARGDLAVNLLVSHHDGTQRRVALQVIDLDVELVAGERFELPATRTTAVDRDVVASVACEAVFAPS